MNYEEKYKSALEWMRSIYPTMQGADKEDAEHYFPELRESEDERIRKEIIAYLDVQDAISNRKDQDFKSWIAWLEKQGEHANFRNKIQVGDKVTRNEDGVLVNLSQLKRVVKPSEKSADKNEPKFKVGDWITNGYYTWKVTDIKPLDYILQSPNGDVVDDTISYVDENLYLWTIQDAKDGDVLADEKPFIFRGFGDKEHPNSPTAYCGITSSGTFILSTENEWWTEDDFYPATKEQRDILFQRMKEAGYEWDAEKKELKKVEQKLSWSEEDEKMVDDIIEAIDTQYAVSDYNEMVSWLKSLKPQSHWKPSEEQISMLLAVLNDSNNITSESVQIALKSLYNDLKNL